MKGKILILLFILSFNLLKSQTVTNFEKQFYEFSDTIFFESNNIFPNSIKIFSNNKFLSDSLWNYNQQKSILIFHEKIEYPFTIYYKVIPFDFKRKYTKYDSIKIIPKISNTNKTNQTKEIQNFDNNNLISNGTINRGISIGNNQDAVLNSKMNLQLSGTISDNLQVEAVISDESMPIEPDGNTAQIQDFNKVFFKIFSPNFSINAGDIDISSHNEFLIYNKQLRGIEYSLQQKRKSDSLQKNNFNFGVAVSKGKFRRQKIVSIEGSQGPYKLLGENGETFIIVLSGSERVYIDGKSLARGETNDYTIDYNSAEISFTPQIPISKDSRIVIEFEYSERNYSRFTTFSNNNFSLGKSNFYINYFSEKDAKNQTIDLELTDSMKQILSLAGDNFNNAVFPTYSNVEYDRNKILYQRKDTLINGLNYLIFIYSNNSNIDLYAVNFSYAGPNSGDYVISEDNINGRVYKWLAPKNDIKQGEYMPEKILVSPKKHSVIEFGANIFINKNSSLNFSSAISNNDKNLYSPIDDSDNLGNALNIDFDRLFLSNKTDSSFCKININFRHVSKNFTEFEKFKNQEFERDWNIDTLFSSDENYLDFAFLTKQNKSFYIFNLKGLLYNLDYIGIKPEFRTYRVGGNLNYDFSLSYLYTRSFHENFTKFFRNSSDINYCYKRFVIGVKLNSEINLWNKKNEQNYSANSYNFFSYGIYIQNKDSLENLLRLEYKKRLDFLPYESMMKISSYSNDFAFIYKLRKTKFNADLLLNYRQLEIKDTLLTKQKSENNLNSRVLFNFLLFKNSITENIFLELSSGLEQKMQYVYIEVEPSKGSYTWNDYNTNGIKEIDEFEIAQFSDQANFVKVPIQSNNYYKVFSKKISNSIIFFPEKIFNEKTKIRNLFSKINNTISFSLEQKANDFNLFDLEMNSSTKYIFTVYNILNINPINRFFLTYYFQQNKFKILLINGIDDYSVFSNKFISKYKINSNWALGLVYEINNKESNSDYSIQRNYFLSSKITNFKIDYSLAKSDLSLHYSYSDKRNVLGDEKLFANNLGISLISVVNKNYQILVDLNFINNNFQGQTTTSVSYIILEGLKPGFNSTWQINLKRKLNKMIQVSLLYSGRYSEGIKIIHNGSINIVAYL